MSVEPQVAGITQERSRLWWAWWRFKRGPLTWARHNLWWPVFYTFWRPFRRFAHRFNWHHMPVHEIEGVKFARCDWCGLTDKVFDPRLVPGGLALSPTSPPNPETPKGRT